MRTTSNRWRLAATIGAAALATTLAAPVAGFAAEDCSPLVTHTPTGSQGDTAAVAITSQVLEADTPGWARAGWQAAEDVTVTKVTVVREDGSEHRGRGNLQSGMAEDVLELRFCGTAGAASDEAPGRTSQSTSADHPSSSESGSEKSSGKGKTDEAGPTASETGRATAEGASEGRADDRGQRPGQDEQTKRPPDEAAAGGSAPDHAAAGGEPAREHAEERVEADGPADRGLDTAAAATPDAAPTVPKGVGGTGEATSDDTATAVMTTTSPPSRPGVGPAHRVEPAAVGTELAATGGIEQALLAARSHGPATLLTWGLLGLLTGAAVTVGAHRIQRGVQR